MKAVRVNGFVEPLLLEAEVPRPKPADGEVLIEVYAAGVTPSELTWYPTTHNKDGSAREAAIPGHEFSGVIAALGMGVKGFSVGDEVYGMSDWFADGATAEYCVAAASSIAPKPTSLSHAEAAAVPIGALTAWQGLIDRAKVQSGERVLIHGGAGAVGVFAIQLARLHGAEIIATASKRHLEFVKEIGAQRAIDYAAGAFEKDVRDVDVVFDCVGGDAFVRSWDVLKPVGRMITVAADNEASADKRRKDAFFIVEPNQEQLIEVGHLLERGNLKVFVDGEVSLSKAPEAYARKIERKHGYGKVVVVLPVNQH